MLKSTIILLVLLVTAASAVAADYALDLSSQTDTVFFRSSARLEFIEGSTQQIEGGFSFDPAQPNAARQGVLRVDLRLLQTGIETRDEHMRDKHLHTDEFPYAYFELKQVETEPGPLEASESHSGKVSGLFYIHGVKRELTADMEFSIIENPTGAQAIKARLKFSILLDEYQIERPKALFLKLAKEIEVELVFSAVLSHPFEPIQLPDWQEVR